MNKKSLVIFSFVLMISLSFVSAGWFSDFFGKTTGNIILEKNEIESLMTFGECSSAASCSDKGYYLTNVLDGSLSTFWYPAHNEAKAKINFNALDSGKSYKIKYAWRGDGNNPSCTGKISACVGDSCKEVFKGKASADKLYETSFVASGAVDALKVEVGAIDGESCGWVRINEIQLEEIESSGNETESCKELGGVLVHPDVCGGEEFQSQETAAGVACCEYNTCGDGICQEGEERCTVDCGPSCKELGGVLVHPDVCGGEEFQSQETAAGVACCEYNTCGDGICQEGEERCTVDCGLSEQACSELIDKVKNPQDFVLDGRGFEKRRSDSYEDSYWSGNGRVNGLVYSASWRSSSESGRKYLDYDVFVAEDVSANLENVLKYYFGSSCSVQEIRNNQYVYVCNDNLWDFENGLNDNTDEERNSVYWIKDNVLVRLSLSDYRYLSESEEKEMQERKLIEFFDSLKDNRESYSGKGNNLNWIFEEIIQEDLEMCGSDVDEPECYSSWDCKIEPSICPPHGEQTKICVDYGSCNKPSIETTQSCSPGMCSGCYVPRWFGSSELDNKCIPYGFRFEQSDLVDVEEVGETAEAGLIVEIYDDSTAYLKFGESDGDAWGWIAFEGTIYEGGTYSFVDSYNLREYQFRVEEIVAGIDGDKGNIRVEFIETFNAYCDIDGRVKMQKFVQAGGEWAKCQNNYECESNVCSSGECIEVQQMFENASKFKELFVTVLCRLSTMFDKSGYSQCVANYMN